MQAAQQMHHDASRRALLLEDEVQLAEKRVTKVVIDVEHVLAVDRRQIFSSAAPIAHIAKDVEGVRG